MLCYGRPLLCCLPCKAVLLHFGIKAGQPVWLCAAQPSVAVPD